MNRSEQAPARVLIVEDETDLRESMVDYLKLDEFQAVGVGTLKAAEHRLATDDCDVLLLDLGLPDGDGLAWLRQRPQLREKGIIMTTARDASTDRIAGARAGADVYLVKPIILEELSSVVGNLVSRLKPVRPGPVWTLNRIQWTLQAPDSQAIKLTQSETRLLVEMAKWPGEAVPRDKLIACLGEDPLTYDPDRLETLVRRLRNKAAATLGRELPLETVYRVGYAFTAVIYML